MVRRLVITSLAALLVWISARPAVAGPAAEAVRQRIRQLERAGALSWSEIPWAASLAAARQQAARESRPIFLFSFEGNLRNGRC
jgi:hypothetical protein